MSDLCGYLCLKDNDELAAQVLDGLAGKIPRYGLPFFGDNNFLPDRIEVVDRIEPARWLAQVNADDGANASANIARLTVTIDRKDMSKTQSELFRMSDAPSAEIPDGAWVEVVYAR